MFNDFGTFLRMLRTGWILIRHDALVPKEYASLVPGPIRMVSAVSRLFSARGRAQNPGERFAAALERLGPAYIKLGQVLGTRGDIFDPAFARGLSRLKDQVPSFSMKEAEAKLASEWGVDWSVHLSSLSEPVAAASVAQVHKGMLKDGTPVAVKILRPKIQERMAADLRVITLVSNLAHRFIPNVRRLQPKAFVKEVKRALSHELDLRLEAAAANEMAEIAVETGLFSVPDVHWELVDKNILVTNWVDGLSMSGDAILDLPIAERRNLAVKVIQSFLSSSFNYGVFHADMHEGNMIYAGGVDGREPKLTLIDFGILGRLGKKEIRFQLETLYGFLQRDYRRIAQVHFDIGFVNPPHTVDDFASALRAVGEPIFGKNAEDVSMAKVLMQLMEITELFDMEMQPQLILLQKTMMQSEGVARRLDPEFDMWEASRSLVEEVVRSELGPQGMALDFLDGARRIHKSIQQMPDAVENITELSRAWRAGEIDLSGPKNGSESAKSKSGASVIKGLACAAAGAILAIGGIWAAGYL